MRKWYVFFLNGHVNHVYASDFFEEQKYIVFYDLHGNFICKFHRYQLDLIVDENRVLVWPGDLIDFCRRQGPAAGDER